MTRMVLLTLAGWALHGCASTMRDSAAGVNYVPGSDYYLIMAEIALQRDQQTTAAREYLNAAEQSDDPSVARRATEFAFEHDYMVYALPAARRWSALAPDDALAHEHAARAYLRRNARDASLRHWRSALGPPERRDEETYAQIASAIAEESNAPAVTWILTRLSAETPDSAALRLAQARAGLRSNQPELSLVAAERAAAAGADPIDAALVVAEARLLLGDWIGAQQLMEGLLSESPQLALEIEYVQMIAAAGDYLRARDELEQLAKDYGVQPMLIRLHGLISLAAGDVDTAEREFARLLGAGYEIYECYFFLGQIAEFRRQHEAAIDRYERISAGPYLVQARVAISQSLSSLGDIEGAMENLADFAASHPMHYFDVLSARARLHERAGNYREAIDDYDEILRYQPNVVSLMNARSIMLDLDGQVDRALRGMRRALSISPTDSDTLNTLGYTLTNRTGRHKEAYELVRAALELDPDNAAIIDSMGWVLFKLGRLEQARSYLEVAHQRIKDPEVVAHLGEVMWKIGEKSAARELMTDTLARFPDSEPLNEAVDRLLN